MRIILFSCLIFSMLGFGQRVKTELLVGETSKEAVLASKNKAWFEDVYNSYHPNENELAQITKLVKKKNKFAFEIYFGTWCPDSRREVPRVYKILELAGYDTSKVKLVGVKTDKKIPNITDEERKQLNVTRVPTIIVYDKKGMEINRYVEFAQTTLEHDLLMILSGDEYKHSYSE